MKVLIVDDEERTREGIRGVIPWKEVGISEVYTADDGEDGLRIAKRVKPELVLTDVRMPHLDGISMAFDINKINPRCRFIFISAYCDKEYLKSAIILSAVNYIEKPVEPEELLESIKKSVNLIQEDARLREYEEQFANVRNDLDLTTTLVPYNWKNLGDITETIEQTIHQRFDDPNLSLTMLSEILGYSKQYLCWVFKKDRSETINQYIVHLRVDTALRIMQYNPNAKVRDVALRVGFTDANYFIKVFKKIMALTPAEYLKSLQRC